MNSRNDGTPTSLYLVRIWRRKTTDEGALRLHGKLQHVVSGASCLFDGLSSLPAALDVMMTQEAGSPRPDLQDPAGDEPHQLD